MQERVLSLHFEGKRFCEHSVPVELLFDISLLNNMLLDIASDIYLEKNQDRERVPKGFRDNVFLSISSVSKGSAVLGIDVCSLNPQKHLFSTKEEEYVNEAFERLTDYINHNWSYTNDLDDDKLARYFNSFGRGLKEGESLTFNYGNEKSAFFDQGTRLSLIKKSSQYNDIIEIYGTVFGVNCDHNTFNLKYYKEKGKEQRIEVSYDKSFKLSHVLDAISERKTQKVFIRGNGLFRDKKLIKIESIDEFQLLNPLDIQSRLNDLMYMEDGWLCEDEGIAPDSESLSKLSEMFDLYYWSDSILPYIYPTPEGNIELEWTVEDKDFILDINLKDFHGLLVTSDQEEIEFDFNNKDQWEILNDHLRGVHNDK